MKDWLLSLNHAAFHVNSRAASNRVAILASLCWNKHSSYITNAVFGLRAVGFILKLSMNYVLTRCLIPADAFVSW